jgi:Domain of Unknown Function (DUF1206)
MTRRDFSTGNIKERAEQTARGAAAHPWVEKLARFGIASKGVVYAIAGILATGTALGVGGKITDTTGVLQTIVTQPFGKFLLSLIAIGLIGYVIWRFVQAITDPENKGRDAKGIAQRVGYALNGVIYAGLAFTAVKLALGTGGAGNSNASQDWTARLLAQPFGQWLVGMVGVFILGTGFYQLYEAYKAKFRRELRWGEMSQTERTWVTRLGRFGLAARGIVFGVTGLFFIIAARQSDPTEVRGLGGVLAAIAQQPYGPWLLGLVALGLIAYGIYMLVQARYRRVVTN